MIIVFKMKRNRISWLGGVNVLVINTIEFEKILHTCGYKLTAQRQAILDIIRDEKKRHLCTEEIYEEDMLESLEEKLLMEKGFTVKDHKVQFFGICKKCADEKNQ